MKLNQFSFVTSTEQIPFPVTLKNAKGKLKTAANAAELTDLQDDGYQIVPETAANTANSRPVSRSRATTSRQGAIQTSRRAQSNSLRVPDWAVVGTRYPAKVVSFQDVYEVTNGVKAETPKYSQTKFSTVVDGQAVEFSALFNEKHPDEGQEVLLLCVADTTGRAVSGKQWEVA